MKNNFKNFRISLVLTLVLAFVISLGAGYPVAAEKEEPASAHVLYVQDIKQYDQIPYLATILKQKRESLNNPAFTYGGELAGGTLYGKVFRGVPIVEALNELGCDAASFGNHDLDYSVEATLELIELAEYPWIAANLAYADGQLFAEDGAYVVVEAGDLKLGIIGFMGELVKTPVYGELIETDFVAAAKEAVAALQEEGVDAIVAISQMTLADMRTLMTEVPEIVLGLREEMSFYSSYVHELADGRYIVSPQADGETLVDACLTKGEDGAISVSLSFVEMASVEADPDFLEKQAAYEEEMEATLGGIVGVAKQDLNRSELGQVAAEAFLYHYEADFGMMNGGGIRGEIAAGDILLKDVYRVLPFDNRPMLYEVSGAAIKAALEQSYNKNLPTQVAGFVYEYDGNEETPAVAKLELADGTPLDLDATYTVAMTSYLKGAYEAFADAKLVKDDKVVDSDLLAAYIEAVKEIPQGE